MTTWNDATQATADDLKSVAKDMHQNVMSKYGLCEHDATRMVSYAVQLFALETWKNMNANP
jgi:hypothetical protein